MTFYVSSSRRRAGHEAVGQLAQRVDQYVIRAYGAALIAAANIANAQAQTGADPSAILTKICDFILGPFGQSLAVLGIIAIGVSWMFGRASLGLIAGVIGGIVIMFGASFIGKTLTGG
jgi:type IV secretory pathway VirB2 component (pilin)